MEKIKIKIAKSVTERLNERALKSKTKRGLKFDELRCSVKQPKIVLNKKRPLACRESIGKRSKLEDFFYRETSEEEDKETFRLDVARDKRRQEEKELSST